MGNLCPLLSLPNVEHLFTVQNVLEVGTGVKFKCVIYQLYEAFASFKLVHPEWSDRL